MNALKPEPGSSIAIFGTGAVGLSALMAAKVVGCTNIIAVDRNADRLALAKELGAHQVIQADTQDAVAEILKSTNQVGVDYALECTGVASVARQAIDATKITGVCGIMGVSPAGTEVSVDLNSIMFGRTIRGIVEGDSIPDIFIPQMIELWRQGLFPFDKLITFYNLDNINEAVKASEDGKVLKAVLRP